MEFINKLKGIFKKKAIEEVNEANLWDLERTDKTIWPEIDCNHWFQQSNIEIKEDSCVRTFKCTKCVAEKKAYYVKVKKEEKGVEK